MDDPEFWTKILPELEKKDPALAEYFLKRQTKQVKRFGMAEDPRSGTRSRVVAVSSLSYSATFGRLRLHSAGFAALVPLVLTKCSE